MDLKEPLIYFFCPTQNRAWPLVFLRLNILVFVELARGFFFFFKPIQSKSYSFPDGSNGKESACNVGGLGSVWVWEDPLEEGMAAHSSILAWRIPMDRGAWRATVHGVTNSRTRLTTKHSTQKRKASNTFLHFSLKG